MIKNEDENENEMENAIENMDQEFINKTATSMSCKLHPFVREFNLHFRINN